MGDDKIPDLRPLLSVKGVDLDILEKVRAVLAREVEPEAASPACAAWVARCHNEPAWHERALEACDELLGGHGVVSLEIEGADYHTDNGVGLCSPLSYVNMGDPYIATLGRDHEKGSWVVMDYASFLEEYEQEHKLGNWEEFDSRPDECPSCNSSDLELKPTPHSSPGGDTYSWVCQDCTHHCYAVVGFDPKSEHDDNAEED